MKCKVFLGAFVNYTNAQNLNCLALAKHLDKDKYEVRAGIGYSGDLAVEKIPGVKYYKMRYPARIWGGICLLRGILWCDVAYLPTPLHWRMCRALLRLFHKRAFKTVETVFTGCALERSLQAEKTVGNLRESLTYTGNTFPITRAMTGKNFEQIGLTCSDGVLYLGVDASFFRNDAPRASLSDVLMIGADWKRKGVMDFLRLARCFPDVTFHLCGGSVRSFHADEEIARLRLGNVVNHGRVGHGRLKELLKKASLHILPSRAEGFPKVILEAAAAGVPSVVYGDYGADEWIATGRNGFVVETVDEMAAVIRDLLDHPEKLRPLADGARELAGSFDWKVRIKEWEKVIDRINGERRL